ncbi:hypothetical protein RRG08_007451 [Elysia crispata]|uniref:Fibrinogen C-terminal domain-containing protein n=1 Tax=Elysia crispata TaxID=231223 RepID=A0AAE1B2T8_9GAST|nr:hypothetical protein RRG08_007451 [Elysia crispata]
MKNTTQEEFIIYTDEDLGKQIRCDAHTDGGGWIVFQRQALGEVDFNRTWNEYRKGFGNLTTDFWLGNEAIYKLTDASAYELRVDFKDRTQGDQFAQYETFKIMDESNNYRLLLGQHVAGTTNEDSTSGLANHNNQDFTTIDRDNDGTPFNCAETNQGGWWYSNCGLANFNSRLPPK